MTLIRALPRESATVQAIGGDLSRWGPAEHLLATVVDRLSVLVWQPTQDGREGKNPPKPYPRPGVVLVDDEERRRSDMFDRLRDHRERMRARRRP